MNIPAVIAIVTATLFTIAGIIIAVVEDDDIEVALALPDTLSISNVARNPVIVKSITINGRPDCIVRLGFIASSNRFEGATLKSGDKRFWVTNCNIIRATIETDRGSAEYRLQ